MLCKVVIVIFFAVGINLLAAAEHINPIRQNLFNLSPHQGQYHLKQQVNESKPNPEECLWTEVNGTSLDENVFLPVNATTLDEEDYCNLLISNFSAEDNGKLIMLTYREIKYVLAIFDESVPSDFNYKMSLLLCALLGVITGMVCSLACFIYCRRGNSYAHAKLLMMPS
ncbi:Hypothetical predicted protein [Cloeon dipterum]|uniref:Uncharacterized protein n=1 Tax=Cloeon dipterum TaxID=197152 RepID=A0A8S1CKV0_9INSE|nr:Hypothetical predicted protein [Cloeon dipterum]